MNPLSEILTKVLIGLPTTDEELLILKEKKINFYHNSAILEELSRITQPIPKSYDYNSNFKMGRHRLDYVDLKEHVTRLVAKIGHHKFLIKAGNSISTLSKVQEKLKSLLFNQMDKNCSATVIVVPAKSLTENKEDSNSYILDSKELCERILTDVNDRHPICNDIAFANQPSAFALGTGFFIRKDVIATAAHVLLQEENLSDVCFIRNFQLNKKKNHLHTDKIVVKKEDVFYPKKGTNLKRGFFKMSERNADWAIVQVNKNNFTSVDVCVDPVRYRQGVYCIGHGLGLPQKISYDGKIIKTKKTKAYFECHLKTYSGNSGSPVFDAETHQLIGMLVRGKTRIKLTEINNRICYQIVVEASRYQGEECQKITPLLNALNDL